MKIEYARIETNYQYLKENDPHVTPNIIRKKIEQNEIIILRDKEETVGWLRFGYFWDMIPIMNMLSLEENYRGRGFGTQLVSFWETAMLEQGHTNVMTTTLSDEQAQHFYRKLGYKDVGALLLPDEALEIIFIKICIEHSRLQYQNWLYDKS